MPKLLVVDDEPSICWALARAAQRLGHEVETVSTAEDALAIVEQQRPDAIVLDVRLPGMDGWRPCAACRNERQTYPL